MAVRLNNPNLQFLDANGSPYSGGKLYFYQSGTSTPLDTYSDEALTTPNSNPVILDSAGRAGDIFISGVSYKVVLKTSADVTVWTVDPVIGNIVTGPAGSTDGNVVAWSGTGGNTLGAGYAFKDEDNMASDSATAVASQQSIKAYADTKIKQGTHTIWIPASAMVARTTNGAAAGTAETTTNKVMLKTLDFDASTIEYAQFQVRMPKSWDEGTVTAVFVWSHASTTTNFKVSWGLQGVALSDDDAGDAAFGTAIYSNDTGGTTDDIYVSPTTAAITIAGTPAAEDLVVFQVLRKADDATNDTLAIDARLHGVTVYYTVNAGDDA